MKPDLLAAQIAPKLDALPDNLGARLLGIFDGVREYLDEMVHAVGLDAVLTLSDSLYDKYAAPYDVKFIPDVLEPSMVDIPAKHFLRTLIKSAHDQVLHSDPPAFVPEVGPMNPPVPADESGASA